MSKQSGFSSLLIIIGILVLTGLAIGGYLFIKSPKLDKSQKSLSPNVHAIQNPISTIPLNASQFERKVVEADNCGNPVGLISYLDPKTGNSMKINNVQLTTKNPYKSSIISILGFINGDIIRDFTDITEWDFAFRDYCGGSAIYEFKEIQNISYPNTDKAKVVIVLAGNGTIGFGELRVYATKGDDVILLNTTLENDPLFKKINDQCQKIVDKTQDFNCYKDGYYNNSEIDLDIKNKVNALINQFAI